jgi:hypothetical protein
VYTHYTIWALPTKSLKLLSLGFDWAFEKTDEAKFAHPNGKFFFASLKGIVSHDCQGFYK